MVKEKINDISKMSGLINQYYKNLGEQMNYTYNRLAKIEANVNAIFKEIAHIKETSNRDREEFRDVVNTIVGSLEELVEEAELPSPLKVEDEKVIEKPYPNI